MKRRLTLLVIVSVIGAVLTLRFLYRPPTVSFDQAVSLNADRHQSETCFVCWKPTPSNAGQHLAIYFRQRNGEVICDRDSALVCHDCGWPIPDDYKRDVLANWKQLRLADLKEFLTSPQRASMRTPDGPSYRDELTAEFREDAIKKAALAPEDVQEPDIMPAM